MKSIRQNKIERLLQKELSEIFQQEMVLGSIKKIITVTNVKVPDMNIANVYVSIYPTTNIKNEIQLINQQKKAIRYVLGKRIKKQFKLIPELFFFVDDSLDYVDNINKLLN